MWNEPSKERLAKIPRLYETEKIRLHDKLIHLHFFIAECDWYVAEFDGNDLFWGFAILNGDLHNAEWGYIAFRELKSIKIKGWLEVDCETEQAWRSRKASEIDKIRIAHGWPKNVGTNERLSKEEELVLKVKAGHFKDFQDLMAEVISPYSEFFGIDPNPIWEVANGSGKNS